MPRRAAALPAPVELPLDVRLMNTVSALLVAGFIAGVAFAGWGWLMKSALFPIRSITLEGEMARNSLPTIRANATPRLAGNFFSVDLQQGRRAFEAVPWVRHAVVRRVWPDGLSVSLEEHHAAALWQKNGADKGDASDKLVNDHGEVFEANVGDVEDDGLPTLQGPEGSAAAMLSLLRRLQPVLHALQLDIDTLHLSGRGSWRAELDSGASIELGRGSEDELIARAERFARTYAQLAERYGARPLDYADLRHVDGYAVRLRGVSTSDAPLKPPARK